NAIAAVKLTGPAELELDAGAAVGLPAGLVDLENLRRQLDILLGTRAGLGLALDPVVIAAGGDLQDRAQRPDGVLGFHRVNADIPLVGGSERMPNVFFNMSRCWRSRSLLRRSAKFWASSSGTESFAPGTGAKTFFHSYSCLSRRPSPAAITGADLPLLIHSVTACCLKLRSNFLRRLISGTTGSFIVCS